MNISLHYFQYINLINLSILLLLDFKSFYLYKYRPELSVVSYVRQDLSRTFWSIFFTWVASEKMRTYGANILYIYTPLYGAICVCTEDIYMIYIYIFSVLCGKRIEYSPPPLPVLSFLFFLSLPHDYTFVYI